MPSSAGGAHSISRARWRNSDVTRPPPRELIPRTLELATSDSRTFADAAAKAMASSVLRTIAAFTAK